MEMLSLLYVLFSPFNSLNPLWHCSHGNAFSPVCALESFQLFKSVVALVTRTGFLSCMCSSVLSTHLICCCIVHKERLSLVYVLFSPFNSLNPLWHVRKEGLFLLYVLFSPFSSLNPLWHCSHGNAFSPVCAPESFQLTKSVVALFTWKGFLSCMCTSVLATL